MSDRFLMPLLIIAGAVLFGLFVYTSVQEQREWIAFAAAHQCHVTGEMSGDWVTGVGSDSSGRSVTTFSRTPDKDGWLCDDGKTYWRAK